MELPQDFADLLAELAAAHAEYVVVGGYAVAFHGHVRATKDIDILVRPTAENAARVYQALAAFGAPLQAFDVAVDDFATYDGVLQIGVAPFRVDILTRMAGASFDEAVLGAPSFEVEGIAHPVVSLRVLLTAKRAAARPQDLADVAALEALVTDG